MAPGENNNNQLVVEIAAINLFNVRLKQRKNSQAKRKEGTNKNSNQLVWGMAIINHCITASIGCCWGQKP